MVNDVRALLQEAAATPPGDDTDLSAVLRAGRDRVRCRRRRTIGGLGLASVAVAGIVALTSITGTVDGGKDGPAGSRVPTPEGPVLSLREARQAVAGKQYDVLSSYANKDLNAANGEYYAGVSDDGLILFQDGPKGAHNRIRWALLDPQTGEKDWLPAHAIEANQRPIRVGADRIVIVTDVDGLGSGLRAEVFDRRTRAWSTLSWPGLPPSAEMLSAQVAPDGRLYVGVPAHTSEPPPGGWPTQPDGDAEDAGAGGDTYELWSASLTDASDVRDEGLVVGSFDFTRDSLVWSDATNGINRRIHVRDLATGVERDFDPRSGARCNLLGFGATADRIVLSQYCGTYANGRDDRVQILTADGRPVTTIQGDDIGGYIADAGTGDGHLVEIGSHFGDTEGTYVYDLDTDRLWQVTDKTAAWDVSGPTPRHRLLWGTPYGAGAGPDGMDQGATQWLVRWR
ncbi:hypothetical protein GCM10022237_14580 [Nocardioides ginsengisoli]|uniref:WD40 repeat domain-containing protein n=1 Tax=Nocardioides ginsengisoli TaxID=363868 RepID=A0ABW3VZ20_9ACTN